VHDPLLVSRLQALDDLHYDAHQLLEPELCGISNRPHPSSVEIAASDHLFDGAARQVFHYDESPAFAFNHVIDSADIRVIQRRCSLGFPLKARQRCPISDCHSAERFESDQPGKPHIFGFVNHSHASFADDAHDAIASGDDLIAFERALA
jgi:hypothetical protein